MLLCHRTLKRKKKWHLYGCAWNAVIGWVYYPICHSYFNNLKSDILVNEERHLFLQGMWTKLWEPACHQTLWDSSFGSALPGGQFRQLECVVSMLLWCVNTRGAHVFEIKSFHMFLTLQVLHMWWWSPILQNRTFGPAVDQFKKANLCRSNKEATEKYVSVGIVSSLWMYFLNQNLLLELHVSITMFTMLCLIIKEWKRRTACWKLNKIQRLWKQRKLTTRKTKKTRTTKRKIPRKRMLGDHKSPAPLKTKAVFQ